jgi:hypothetical protein
MNITEIWIHKWANAAQTEVLVACPIFGNTPFKVNHEWINTYGRDQRLQKFMILVTKQLLIQIPRINQD